MNCLAKKMKEILWNILQSNQHYNEALVFSTVGVVEYFCNSPYNLSKGSSILYGVTVLKSMLCQYTITFSLFHLKIFLVFSLTCFITLFLTRHPILVLNSVFSVKMWCLSFFLTLNLAWFVHGMFKYADAVNVLELIQFYGKVCVS